MRYMQLAVNEPTLFQGAAAAFPVLPERIFLLLSRAQAVVVAVEPVLPGLPFLVFLGQQEVEEARAF